MKTIKTNHTPGPWVVDNTLKPFQWEAGVVVPRVRMNGACDALIASLGVDRNEADHNAALIAAAPDLLEALKEVVQYLGGCRISTTLTAKGRDESIAMRNAAIESAKSAIARVEGNSQTD